MSKIKKVMFVTGLVVLAFAALGVTVVFASNNEQAIDQDLENGLPHPSYELGLLQQIFDREEIQNIVAETLGISVEDLVATRTEGIRLRQIAVEQDVTMEEIRVAVDAYKTEAVQDALEEGLVTEAQSQWLLQHDGRLIRQNIRSRVGNLLQNIIDKKEIKAVTAESLNMTVEEFDVARQSGSTVFQIAEEEGVFLETIRQVIRDSFEEMVDQAVEDGFVTQFQADRILTFQGRPGIIFQRAIGQMPAMAENG